MAEYRLSIAAGEDLIRIHHFGNDNMVEIISIVGMQDLKNLL
jgi:hypothetical protein